MEDELEAVELAVATPDGAALLGEAGVLPEAERAGVLPRAERAEGGGVANVADEPPWPLADPAPPDVPPPRHPPLPAPSRRASAASIFTSRSSPPSVSATAANRTSCLYTASRPRPPTARTKLSHSFQARVLPTSPSMGANVSALATVVTVDASLAIARRRCSLACPAVEASKTDPTRAAACTAR